MDTNSIGTVAGNAAAVASSAGTGSGQSLGQNQFLQLLMTQLQNQDPMSPMDNTQFIAPDGPVLVAGADDEPGLCARRR